MSWSKEDTGLQSGEAGQALLACRIVKFTNTGSAVQVEYVSGTGDHFHAVTLDSQPTIGDIVPLLLGGNGVAKCEAGAAVALGATVTANASGQVVAGTGVGVALEAAGAAGDIIAVLLYGVGSVLS